MSRSRKSGGKHAAQTGESPEQSGGSHDATSPVQQDAALQSGMEVQTGGTTGAVEGSPAIALLPPPTEAHSAPPVAAVPVIQSADVLLGQVGRVVSDLLADKQRNEQQIETIVDRLGKFGFGPNGEPLEMVTNGHQHVRSEPAVVHKPKGRRKLKNGRKLKAKAAVGGGSVSEVERPRGWVKQQCVKIVSTHKAGISGLKISEVAKKQGISPKDISGGLQAARRSYNICYLTPDAKSPGTGKGGLYFPASVVAEAVMNKVIAQIEAKKGAT